MCTICAVCYSLHWEAWERRRAILLLALALKVTVACCIFFHCLLLCRISLGISEMCFVSFGFRRMWLPLLQHAHTQRRTCIWNLMRLHSIGFVYIERGSDWRASYTMTTSVRIKYNETIDLKERMRMSMTRPWSFVPAKTKLKFMVQHDELSLQSRDKRFINFSSSQDLINRRNESEMHFPHNMRPYASHLTPFSIGSSEFLPCSPTYRFASEIVFIVCLPFA